MGIIALLFLKAGWNRLQNWLATNKEVPISPSWIFDWNSVTPGKALAEYVGPTWVNWILWPIVALIAFLVIRTLYRTFFAKAAGGAKSSDGGSTWLLWLAVLIMVAGFSSLVTQQATKSPLPGVVLVPYPTFNKMGIGRSVVTGGYESTYQVSYPQGGPANTGQRYDICIKVTKPQALPVAPIYDRGPAGQQVQDIRFSERTKTALMRYGKLVQEVEMTFEYALTKPGENPCEVVMAKMAGE